ncbi:hypothetical protein ACFOOM_07545 [Streptomyces echinoruber]|uniref:Uncharacterized protein n=1 Tax=Streptomyces echinoruber TaxID=68898 RepID=A0A918V8Q7_9ACTN|nr:hypothetical protein [Streptomyces echinoruber]GGZ80229.1 hypothetical protein GCM10010389_17470 [Streptomyces echinoruber]
MVLWQPGQRITAQRLQTASPTDVASYTPTVTNGGTVTFSIQTGFYSITDSYVDVIVYLAVSGAGSGSGIVQVDMPTPVDRTIRQALTVHGETVGVNGSGSTQNGQIRGGECVFFTSGSGARSDRIRIDDSDGDGSNNLLGVDLKAGGLITIQGRYRKA